MQFLPRNLPTEADGSGAAPQARFGRIIIIPVAGATLDVRSLAQPAGADAFVPAGDCQHF
jgi:hypothetical protein